jgi:hypothetical protein
LKITEINLPVQVSKTFQNCTASDGAVRLAFRREHDYLGNIELEWLTSNDTAIFQIYEPLGRTLLKAEYLKRTRGFVYSGLWAYEMPEITVNKENFINIKGQLMGLKLSEVACLLNSNLPSSWLNQVVWYSSQKNKTVLKIEDKARKIRVVSTVNQGDEFHRKTCANIKWSNWFGIIKNNIDICLDQSKSGNSGRLVGVGDYAVEWENLDERQDY